MSLNSLFLWTELWKGLADFLGYLTHKLLLSAPLTLPRHFPSYTSIIRGNMTKFPNT